MKEEGHLGRCYLKGHAGDAANAILTAAGYNFRRILAWLEDAFAPNPVRPGWLTFQASPPSIRLLNGRLRHSAVECRKTVAYTVFNASRS